MIQNLHKEVQDLRNVDIRDIRNQLGIISRSVVTAKQCEECKGEHATKLQEITKNTVSKTYFLGFGSAVIFLVGIIGVFIKFL